jgi:thioredoxin 1
MAGEGNPDGPPGWERIMGNVSMKIGYHKIIVGVFFLLLLLVLARPADLFAAAPPDIPVKGMVTMVDLGAKKCIPCKMMAPILSKLEKAYAGRAAIVFLDVWEDPKPAHRFGIRGIPTQIFFDKEGKEVFRHLGFLSEEEIVRRLKDMGVK